MAAAQAIGTPGVLECDLSHFTEEQLIWAAKAGNEMAFVELSRRYSRYARAIIHRIVRNREDAEDVLQETLLRAFRRLDQFRGTASFSTWFARIAINQAFMLLRTRRGRPEISYDMGAGAHAERHVWEFPDLAPTPEAIYAKTELEEKLRRAVRSLPASFRGIVDLFHGEEFSVKKAADALGITVPAAKSRLMRARLTLRRCCSESLPKFDD
jgi:RNA polymerase sigma-70 factor, ECF subfamily